MTRWCDICGRSGHLKLIASGCAPVTYDACRECRSLRADELDVAATWFLLEGGIAASDAHLSRLVTWLDGAYAGEQAVRAHSKRYLNELIQKLNANDDLYELPADREEGDLSG